MILEEDDFGPEDWEVDEEYLLTNREDDLFGELEDDEDEYYCDEEILRECEEDHIVFDFEDEEPNRRHPNFAKKLFAHVIHADMWHDIRCGNLRRVYYVAKYSILFVDFESENNYYVYKRVSKDKYKKLLQSNNPEEFFEEYIEHNGTKAKMD